MLRCMTITHINKKNYFYKNVMLSIIVICVYKQLFVLNRKASFTSFFSYANSLLYSNNSTSIKTKLIDRKNRRKLAVITNMPLELQPKY